MNRKKLLSGLCFSLLGITMNAQNIFPTTGSVGIGTSSPQHSLHLKKTSSTDGDLKIDNGKITIGNVSDVLMEGQYRAKILTDGALRMRSAFPYISLLSSNSNIKSRVGIDIAIAIGDTYFSNISNTGDLVFKMITSTNGGHGASMIFGNEDKNVNNHFKFTTTASNETSASTKFIIRNDGNVGIGTETPDAKLAVNGVIHSKEVRIDLNNWPDYVFEDSYQLPTLIEAEQHIKENKHLINMPSAQTIETDGVEVGEITRLQQEKIEELTLYIIELNKRIEALEQQLETIRL